MTDRAPRSDFAEAPARATLRPLEGAGGWHGVPAQTIELISRGDILGGVLVRGARRLAPVGDARPALLLLAHDAGSSATAADLRPVAGWVGEGLGAVAIDLPLHGHRASPKLSERLITSIATLARGGALDPNGAVLAEEFLRQATADVIRTLDALLALDEFDPKRIGFLGLGLGAWVGASLLSHDRRVHAAVLAQGRTAPCAQVPPGRATDPPATSPGATTTDVLVLDLERGQHDWAALARPFLASRLGF